MPVLEDVELFRVVNVDRPHHPGLVLDLTSNYERQARPRRIERYYSVVHMAVSTFTTVGRGSASTFRHKAHIAPCGVHRFSSQPA